MYPSLQAATKENKKKVSILFVCLSEKKLNFWSLIILFYVSSWWTEQNTLSD